MNKRKIITVMAVVVLLLAATGYKLFCSVRLMKF